MYISLFYKPFFFADQLKLMGERLGVRGEGGGVCVSRKSLINKRFLLADEQGEAHRRAFLSRESFLWLHCIAFSRGRNSGRTNMPVNL
jgi:hypothetical protein